MGIKFGDFVQKRRDQNLAVRSMHYIRRECVVILLVEFNLVVCFAIAKLPNFNSWPNFFRCTVIVMYTYVYLNDICRFVDL